MNYRQLAEHRADVRSRVIALYRTFGRHWQWRRDAHAFHRVLAMHLIQTTKPSALS